MMLSFMKRELNRRTKPARQPFRWRQMWKAHVESLGKIQVVGQERLFQTAANLCQRDLVRFQIRGQFFPTIRHAVFHPLILAEADHRMAGRSEPHRGWVSFRQNGAFLEAFDRLVNCRRGILLCARWNCEIAWRYLFPFVNQLTLVTGKGHLAPDALLQQENQQKNNRRQQNQEGDFDPSFAHTSRLSLVNHDYKTPIKPPRIAPCRCPARTDPFPPPTNSAACSGQPVHGNGAIPATTGRERRL